MTAWYQKPWFHWTMLATGTLLFVLNVALLLRGIRQADHIQVFASAVMLLLLPVLAWQDQRRRKGTS